MTDRELLELAAKAAGIEQGADRADCGISTTLPDGRHGHLPRWNPLEDDGDALRLVVKLGLRVYTPEDGDDMAVVRDYSGLHVQEIGDDHNKITRRAITRAAAEIGKQK